MKIYQEDLDWAVSQSLITEEQANALWNALSQRHSHRPQFNFVNVTFYFGVLIVISAMTWFMTLAWESFGVGGIFILASIYALCFIFAGSNLWWQEGMKIPGELRFTIYRQLELRDRILNLPLMVADVLTLLWRQVPGVTEL